MRPYIAAVLLLLALASTSNAQEAVIGLELGGRAGIYSTNFEGYRLGVGAGVAVWGGGRNELAVIVPMYLSARPLGDKHSIYTSAGATIARSNLNWFGDSRRHSTSVFGSASVGYQYRTDRGFVIRPAAHLLFQRSQFIVWPGLMIGRSF